MSGDSPAYNELAFKASHNSYSMNETLGEQLAWHADQPQDGGCRGVEIDITRHSDSSGGTSLNYFQVTHSPGGSGWPLATYLDTLLSWHRANADHGPIFVDLDIKSSKGSSSTFPDEIDAYLTEYFDSSILYTPGNLIGDSGKDLVTAVQSTGWPLLSTLTGRFIFCLSGTDSWKKEYAATSPTTRLCFADFGVDDDDTAHSVTSGNRAIANINVSSDDFGKWKKLVANLRQQACLVRAYVLNSESLWQQAQGAGVNILATDKVKGSDWATVGGEPFAASPVPD